MFKNKNLIIMWFFTIIIKKMDIIYKLPILPVCCDKIFGFACKSPHTGLCITILKKKLKTKDLDIPNKDKDVKELNNSSFRNTPDTSSINLEHFSGFDNLERIRLDKREKIFYHPPISNFRVSGDICYLNSMLNLIEIDLSKTDVSGNISNFKLLKNLTVIGLHKTKIWGDISNLDMLLNLVKIDLSNTKVSGNVVHLKSLINLEYIILDNTNVSGNSGHLKSLPNLIKLSLSSEVHEDDYDNQIADAIYDELYQKFISHRV